jgi:hypothetical protein
MQANFQLRHGYRAGASEVRSWRNSLPRLAGVLGRVDDLANCRIYLEYEMPSSSARADAVIVGMNGAGRRAAVVVELKQWDRSVVPAGSNIRVGGEVRPHPSDQALGYREYLEDLSAAVVRQGASVASCAFLHNLDLHGVSLLRSGSFAKLTSISPLFGGLDEEAMAAWLAGLITGPPESSFIQDMDAGEVAVSKPLFEYVSRAVQEEPAWVLLDGQRAAYNLILDIVGAGDGEKHVVMVEGGPGTGKSIVAMQLMGELCRREIPTVHITNSKSFTTVMRSLVTTNRSKVWGSKAVEGLFRLSHAWVKNPARYRVAICDEAHRFRMSTDLFPYLASPRPQIDEILENVDVVAAFLDEKQMLRRAESGSVDYFTQAAARAGVPRRNVHGPVILDSQFRSAGSADFVAALDRTIYESSAQPFTHGRFESGVAASVEELTESLQARRAEGNSVRLVAGFCWPWSNPNADGSLPADVVVGSWSRPWNAKAVRSSYPPASHPYTIWARRLADPLSEIGCIYSAQGFEFDYVGVLWGADLIWRGRWVAAPEASHDVELTGGRSRSRRATQETAERLIKNAYRVLSTRALRGVYFYAVDKETNEHLRAAFGTL